MSKTALTRGRRRRRLRAIALAAAAPLTLGGCLLDAPSGSIPFEVRADPPDFEGAYATADGHVHGLLRRGVGLFRVNNTPAEPEPKIRAGVKALAGECDHPALEARPEPERSELRAYCGVPTETLCGSEDRPVGETAAQCQIYVGAVRRERPQTQPTAAERSVGQALRWIAWDRVYRDEIYIETAPLGDGWILAQIFEQRSYGPLALIIGLFPGARVDGLALVEQTEAGLRVWATRPCRAEDAEPLAQAEVVEEMRACAARFAAEDVAPSARRYIEYTRVDAPIPE